MLKKYDFYLTKLVTLRVDIIMSRNCPVWTIYEM